MRITSLALRAVIPTVIVIALLSTGLGLRPALTQPGVDIPGSAYPLPDQRARPP